VADGARCINRYLVEVGDVDASLAARRGKKSKVDPSRLLYALRWLHRDAWSGGEIAFA
jgi:hypothetical protein